MATVPNQVHGVLMNDNTIAPNTGKIQRATITAYGLILTGATYDAELAKWVTLKNAMAAVSRGSFITSTFAGHTIPENDPDVPAASSEAQVNLGWIVRLREVVVFRPHSFRIACANNTFLAANREHMDTTLGVYTDLVAAVEAFVQYNGNAVEVRDILWKGKAS